MATFLGGHVADLIVIGSRTHVPASPRRRHRSRVIPRRPPTTHRVAAGPPPSRRGSRTRAAVRAVPQPPWTAGRTQARGTRGSRTPTARRGRPPTGASRDPRARARTPDLHTEPRSCVRRRPIRRRRHRTADRRAGSPHTAASRTSRPAAGAMGPIAHPKRTCSPARVAHARSKRLTSSPRHVPQRTSSMEPASHRENSRERIAGQSERILPLELQPERLAREPLALVLDLAPEPEIHRGDAAE